MIEGAPAGGRRQRGPARLAPRGAAGGRPLRWPGGTVAGCTVLAGLWLVDAGLQLQPPMFTRAFPANVLYAAALMYQPRVLAGVLVPIDHLLSSHLVALNVGVAATQTLIAVGLLVPRTRRPALWASAAWAAIVWVGGEGLGGMATGTALVEFGAPGPALMYAAVSLLVLRASGPGRGAATPGASARPAGAAAPRAVWSGYWLLGALLHVPLIHPAGGVLAYNLQSAAQDQPGGLAAVDYALARVAYLHAAPISIGLALLEVGIALLVWHRRWRPATLWVGCAAALGFWVVGQAMGGVATGLAPDPGALAPLLILALLVAAAGSGPARAGGRGGPGSASADG